MLQPIKMRNCITLILFGISILCSAQTDKKAENKEVEGVILFRFIPDTKFQDYYCYMNLLYLQQARVMGESFLQEARSPGTGLKDLMRNEEFPH